MMERLIREGLAERAAEALVPADAWERQRALLTGAAIAPGTGEPAMVAGTRTSRRPWWRRWVQGAEVAVFVALMVGLIAVGHLSGPERPGGSDEQAETPPAPADLNPLAAPPVPRVVLSPDLPTLTPPAGALTQQQIIDAAIAAVNKEGAVRGGKLTLDGISLTNDRWELTFRGDGRAFSFTGGPAPLDRRKDAYSHVAPVGELTYQITAATGEIYGVRTSGAPLDTTRTDLEHYRGYVVSGGQQTTLRLVRADGGLEGRDLTLWVPGQALKESGLDLWHLTYGVGRLVDVWGLTTAPREVLAYRLEMADRPDEALLAHDVVHGIPIPDGARVTKGIYQDGAGYTLSGHTMESLKAWYAEQMPNYGWEEAKRLTSDHSEAMVLRFVTFGWQYAQIAILPDPDGVQFVLSWGMTRIANQDQAATAVFRALGEDPVFQHFPRNPGAAMGEFNGGGPPPGESIRATFETRVRPEADGAWEVELVRSWGEGLRTIWRFRVEPDGVVQTLGQSGDLPPVKP